MRVKLMRCVEGSNYFIPIVFAKGIDCLWMYTYASMPARLNNVANNSPTDLKKQIVCSLNFDMTNLAYFMKIRSFPHFFVAGEPNSNKMIFGQFCSEMFFEPQMQCLKFCFAD